ncbi:hypothetical protein FRC01_000980 [Tulasnella sp. 417]|nr:hypothetical protein FRC01_000980 [Tulasnella sp. 417]
MATLIARLPSIRRNDGAASSNSGHQRLESAPPSPLAEEADLATLPNEPASPDDDPSDKKRWKGKGIDPAERRGSASSSPQTEEEDDDGAEPPDATAAPGAATESYPPMKDEELETRRVQENLRRWEEVEKQRRKAARESRTARTPSTLISDVAGYVTSFGSKPASRRKDSRTDSVGTIPSIPDGAATRAGGWTAASTRDSEDVELEPPKDPKRTPPDATPTKANFQKRLATRPSQSSIVTTDSAATVTSGPRNPFSTPSGAIPVKPSEERDEPFTPPDHHLISREASASSTATSGSAEDPFKNPEGAKTDLDLPLLSTPKNLSPATSPRVDKGMSLLQVPRSPKRSRSPSNAAAKRTSVKQPPPSVRPLDLPEPTMPRMEPEPASGHWRRVQDAKQRDRAIQEELEEDRAKGGRWWTDWICGCRESNVREEQAGRTNPFE